MLWHYIVAAVLLAHCWTALVLRKVYFRLPLVELARRAQAGDLEARILHRAAAFGASLLLLLWTVFGLAAAGAIALFTSAVPLYLSFVAVFLFLWLSMGLVPNSRHLAIEKRLTLWLTPALAWLLHLIHAPLGRIMHFTSGRIAKPSSSGLYAREDLLKVIAQQATQPDNRIPKKELELAASALKFDDHKVRDVLRPRRKIHKVAPSDTVGPVLLDELHKGDLAVFPVLAGKEVVGLLHLKDVGLKNVGRVRDFIDEQVCFVHEDDNLSLALSTFSEAKAPLLVVINNFEEYVGVVTVEDALKPLLGVAEQPDTAGDIRDKKAVAARHKKSSLKKKIPETTIEMLE